MNLARRVTDHTLKIETRKYIWGASYTAFCENFRDGLLEMQQVRGTLSWTQTAEDPTPVFTIRDNQGIAWRAVNDPNWIPKL